MMSTQGYINQLSANIKENYEILSEYKGHLEKIKVKHKICNKEFYVAASIFKNRNGICRYCNGGVKFDNSYIDEFLRKTTLQRNSNTEYINQTTYIELHCNKCDKNVIVRPQTFFKDGKCPYCNNRERLNERILKERIEESFNGKDYEILNGYFNGVKNKNIPFIHKSCGNKFMMSPKEFLHKGSRCPFCKKSKGEFLIKESLEKRKFNFIWSYRDNNCKSKKKLEFDFKVFIDDKTFFYIEYDGSLHFKTWKDGEKHLSHLKRQIENDKLKNRYCEDNKIPLLRIPYWEKDNIDTIIEKISSTTMNKQVLFLECKRLTFEMGSISTQEDIEMKI